MPIKKTLRQWLADGETERVLEALQNIAEQPNDNRLESDVILQAGRYTRIKQDFQRGVLDKEFYNIQLNQIQQALLELIKKVPEDAVLPIPPVVFPPPIVASQTNDTTAAEPTPTTNEKNTTSVKPPSNVIWIVGLTLLVGVTLLAALIPCPSSFLSTAARVLMAIGAALAATVLPGLLQIDLPNVKAGSALAVLVLVYLFNPAKAMEDNSQCDKLPFEFTISLQPDKSAKTSNQYPKLENTNLQIHLANEWKDAPTDANGDADFKNIAGDYKNQKVEVRLQAKYWKLEQDSISLIGKSQTLTIVPDGTLGVVTGKVMDAKTGNSLQNVKIEIAGITSNSNENGIFKLEIPLEKQRANYEVYATKANYKPDRGNVAPATGQEMKILLSKIK